MPAKRKNPELSPLRYLGSYVTVESMIRLDLDDAPTLGDLRRFMQVAEELGFEDDDEITAILSASRTSSMILRPGSRRRDETKCEDD